jgi:hypothetical protein
MFGDCGCAVLVVQQGLAAQHLGELRSQFVLGHA